MTDSITVTLAGKLYTIQQLDLGQLRDLSVGVTLPDAPDPQEAVKRSFDRAVNIISTAIREANPELTAEALYKMRVTRDELRQAQDAILQLAGLVPAMENKPGEAQAGA